MNPRLKPGLWSGFLTRRMWPFKKSIPPPNPADVAGHWHEIETWLKVNAPDVYAGLNPPATAQQIAEAEATLGITFPADCLATFQIHNGQASDSPWLLDAWEFMSLERVVHEWKVWKELLDAGEFKESESESDGTTVKDWWSARWIPLTYDGAGNHDSLDLSPGPKGRPGQIIKMWHDESERPLVATSHGAWIADFAAAMQRGRCHFSDEYGGVVRDEK